MELILRSSTVTDVVAEILVFAFNVHVTVKTFDPTSSSAATVSTPLPFTSKLLLQLVPSGFVTDHVTPAFLASAIASASPVNS